ncbi:olfactory receptor 6F1-like [Choloepus didactylus]|uniref:olfactory receptor 6F1-like n=1 Tax=Choloepus didactylus TaxID=27675 RepID=UPI0018A03DE4|nr:olfactory receptor 6F1-like [Choloepus didactylus]
MCTEAYLRETGKAGSKSTTYFFLKNVSFLDICYTSVTIPKALMTSLMHSRVIYYLECLVQLHRFFTFGSTECFLLTSMVYDQCLATYMSLFYASKVSQRLCAELVIMAWVAGAIYSALHTHKTFYFPFCGHNVVEYFFCDILLFMRLSCTNIHTNEEVGFAISSSVIMSYFALTVHSYVFISTIALLCLHHLHNCSDTLCG